MILLLPISALGQVLSTDAPKASSAPQAVVNPNLSIEAELGYSGAITYMRDIPLTVTIENKGPDVEGAICVNLYRNTRFYDRYEYSLSLASGAKKQIVMPINLKMRQDHYVIEFSSGGTVLASVIKTPARMIKPEAVLIGVLSADPQAVSYMNQDTLAGLLSDRYEAWQLVSLNADTFPTAESLMKSFMILVVDGFDASTLSADRQQVLDRWISAGGIVIIGGGAQAATDYPYFSKYTGLNAGSIKEAEDITPALLQTFAYVGGKPLMQKVLVNEITSGDFPLAKGEFPLIYMHSAGSGLIYTAAFELGAKPLSTWQGIAGLWPRVLLSSANRQYNALYNQVSNNMYGGNGNTYMLENVPIETVSSTVPMIILLVVYLLLAGVGSYLLLKKLDKREYLWFTVPVMALVCMLALYVVGENQSFNKPTAATFTTVRINMQGEAQVSSIGSVASPDSGEVLIRAENGVAITPIDPEGYYYDMPENAVPQQQKFRVLMGDDQAVAYAAGAPWDRRLMSFGGAAPEIGALTGKVWMEEDGLHGEIVNNTPYTFSEGVLLTNLGFAKVGAMAPGGSAKTAILKPKKADSIKAAVTSVNIYEAKIKEGVMISSNVMRNSDLDMYPFIRAYVYPETQIDDSTTQTFWASITKDESTRRNFVESAIGQAVNMNAAGSSAWVSPYHYIAFQSDIGQSKLSVNGQEIKRAGHQAVVDVLLSYEPIGPTGIVSYPLGTLPVYPMLVNIDGSFMVQDDKPIDPYMSYQIAQQPAFCFKLPDLNRFTLTDINIIAASYDTVPVMQIYNHKTSVWDEEKTISATFDGQEILPYVGAEGELFVRFVPGKASREYDSVMAPSITLEGRQK